MKKIVLAGLAALSVLAISQQQASAWVNSRFGVGLNWDIQSGGNNFLWGAYRNGQPPGPEYFGGGGGHGGPAFNGGGYGGPAFDGGGYGGPAFNAPMPQPYFGSGSQPQGYPPQGFNPMPQNYPSQGFSPTPQTAPPQFVPHMPYDASMAQPAPYAGQYASPFQFATYARPVYYYPGR